jgi:hypothetical protein
LPAYVALSKKLANIRDVYDEAELKSHTPSLRFLQEVDKRTGYRTKQMLVAPMVDAHSGELLGVVQLINNKAGTLLAGGRGGRQGPVRNPRHRLRPAQKPAHVVKSKYDHLVADAVLSAANSISPRARRGARGLDIEEVLINEFQVKLAPSGRPSASSSACPTSPSRRTASSRWTC